MYIHFIFRDGDDCTIRSNFLMQNYFRNKTAQKARIKNNDVMGKQKVKQK